MVAFHVHVADPIQMEPLTYPAGIERTVKISNDTSTSRFSLGMTEGFEWETWRKWFASGSRVDTFCIVVLARIHWNWERNRLSLRLTKASRAWESLILTRLKSILISKTSLRRFSNDQIPPIFVSSCTSSINTSKFVKFQIEAYKQLLKNFFFQQIQSPSIPKKQTNLIEEKGLRQGVNETRHYREFRIALRNMDNKRWFGRHDNS